MTFPANVDDNPNPWAMRHDDTKTLITLASAVLAVSVTFAKDIVEERWRWLLMVGWVALLVSIVCSIFASGTSVSGARDQHDGDFKNRRCTAFLNGSFWALAAGALLLALAAMVGWKSTPAASNGLDTAATSARAAVGVVTGEAATSVQIDEVQVSDTASTLMVREPRDKAVYVVTVDRDGSQVRSVRRQP